MKIMTIPYENHENHGNHTIPLENNENHENLRIPFEYQENCKILNFHAGKIVKNMKIIEFHERITKIMKILKLH